MIVRWHPRIHQGTRRDVRCSDSTNRTRVSVLGRTDVADPCLDFFLFRVADLGVLGAVEGLVHFMLVTVLFAFLQLIPPEPVTPNIVNQNLDITNYVKRTHSSIVNLFPPKVTGSSSRCKSGFPTSSPAAIKRSN